MSNKWVQKMRKLPRKGGKKSKSKIKIHEKMKKDIAASKIIK